MLNLILKIIIIASIVQTTSYATELNFEVKSSQASEDVLVDKTNEELEEKKEEERRNQLIRGFDFALQTHNYDKIKNYLNNGNSINQRTFDQNTIVNLAIMRNDIDLLEIAINYKANFLNQNKNGENVIMQSSLLQKNDLLKILKDNLDKKVWESLLKQTSKHQRNALHYTSLGEGNLENAKLLVKEKININHQDLNKQTPLHYAIILGHFEIAKFLLESGANIQIKDNFDLTPEDYIFQKFNMYQQLELKKYVSKDNQRKIQTLPI